MWQTLQQGRCSKVGCTLVPQARTPSWPGCVQQTLIVATSRVASEHEEETSERFCTQYLPQHARRGKQAVQVVYERCVGLDVHQKTGVACVLITSPDGTLQREIRTFSTMTADLLLLNDWLETLQVSVVALESTGVFWRPVFNLLEDGRTIVLVNPQRVLCGAWTQDGCQGCRVGG